MIEDIISLCKIYMIDFLDIKTIQTIALKTKRYDLLVYAKPGLLHKTV